MSYGQSIYSGVHVPAQVLPSKATDMQMPAFAGYVASGTQVDPLSHYQRSRLGRWEVAKEAESDQSVFGVELQTPAGAIRIRFEATIDGQPFRAAREKTIDGLLKLASGAPVEETASVQPKKLIEATEADDDQQEMPTAQTYVATSSRDRMVAYVQSRGDRLTRHELRRRVADIAGGPALLRTNSAFGAQRNKTVTLFSFLDADEDGAISPKERSGAMKVLNDCDTNSNGQVEWRELQSALKSRKTERQTDSTAFGWKNWNANQSGSDEDLIVNVAFDDADAANSGLTIEEFRLEEPWSVETAKIKNAYVKSTPGSVVLLTHPKFAVALNVAQPAETAKTSDQISLGVALEPNALFRSLDRNGDWKLSGSERRLCDDTISAMDANADNALTVDELPILFRVCVSRGATAHDALADAVTIDRRSNEPNEQSKMSAPAWFTSMDQDADQTLTRKEFLGSRDSFDEIDTDEDSLLTLKEVLAAQPD